jgi:hypothetical protein
MVAYNLDRVVDVLVSSELSLHVQVSKRAFFHTQSLSVRTENSSVEGDGR